MIKNKHILILLFIGTITVTIGAFLKITHNTLFDFHGNQFLSAGLIIEFIAVVLLLFKIAKSKKAKQFLNS